MKNLCPQVTVSSTPKLTSRFKIRVQKDFQAILGEEEDVRNRGGGKGDLPRPTSDTPRNESFKFLFFSKTKDPPQKLGTAHHRQSSAGLAEEFDFG